MDGGMNIKKAALHAMTAHEGRDPFKKPSPLQDGWLKRGEHRTTKHILGRPSAFAKVFKGAKKGVATSPVRTPRSQINWDSARVRDTYSLSKYSSLLLPKAKPVPDVSKWQPSTPTKERAGFRKPRRKSHRKSRRKPRRKSRRKPRSKPRRKSHRKSHRKSRRKKKSKTRRHKNRELN